MYPMTAPAVPRYSTAFRTSMREWSFQGYLRIQVETIVAENAMVRREGKDDLSGSSNEVGASFLCPDSIQQGGGEVYQCDMMCELRLVIDTINLTTIL